MGASHSASEPPAATASAAAPQCPVPHAQRTASHPLFASMHGASGAAAAAAAAPAPAAADAPQCPVPHAQRTASHPLFASMGGGGASAAAAAAPAAAPAAPAAPLPAPSRSRGPVYNVYGQEIDPLNMMPPPNQSMTPGQAEPLPTERVPSSIKKGGTDGTWLYPSPQMFWNSLHRKGKADGVREGDVSMVVTIHNEMNERTWRQLLEWESLHAGEHLDGEPALRHFMGNPYKLSPKAQLKRALGLGLPFDRHDWMVDRGGRKRHYVIDYYFNPAGEALAPAPAAATAAAPSAAKLVEAGKLATPAALPPLPAAAPGEPGFDPDASARFTRQIYVDVRPAVEDLSSLADRLRMFPSRLAAALRRPRFTAEGLDPAGAPKEGDAAGAPPAYSSEMHSEARAGAGAGASAAAAAAAAETDPLWQEIDRKCAPLLEALKAAKSEEERRPRALALNYAMGRVLCPAEAAAYMEELERAEGAGAAGAAGGNEEKAFASMASCIRGAVERRGGGGAAGGAGAKAQQMR